MNAKPDWSIADADELYRISGWGAGYFRLNADGNLVVSAPLRNGNTAEIAANPCPSCCACRTCWKIR